MILVDTNILVAVANDRDNHHQQARELLETLPDELLVSPTVIAEVCYLLHERAGPAAEVQFLSACFGTWLGVFRRWGAPSLVGWLGVEAPRAVGAGSAVSGWVLPPG